MFIILPDGKGFFFLPDIKISEEYLQDENIQIGLKEAEERIEKVCGQFVYLLSAIILSGYMWYVLHLSELINSMVSLLRFDIMLTRKKGTEDSSEEY